MAKVDAASRPDVLVVGGGAIGVACAYYLAERGADVLLVDEREDVGLACSYGNAGLISPSHCIPLARPGLLRNLPGWLRPGGAVYIKPRLSADLLRFGLALLRSCSSERMLAGLRALRDASCASRDLFEELVIQGLDFGYRRAGLMNVCSTRQAYQLLQEDVLLLEREGLEPEVLDASEVLSREPTLREGIAGGVYWSEDAHCDPGRFVRALARAARDLGARIELRTSVLRLKRAGGGTIDEVQTSRNTLHPRWVVLAAGSWSAALARSAGVRLPLEPGKGYHVHIAAGAPPLRVPVILQESACAATPIGDGLRLAGTMEFVGLDEGVLEERAHRLFVEATSYLTGLDRLAETTTWTGLRPCTPDTLPVVGRSMKATNLVYATGHAMLGLTLAPVTGLAAAEIVLGKRSSIDVAAFSPDRFGA